MARFLIATMPVPGHVAPMATVVRRLIECGHEVVWYGSSFFQSKIEATGARFVPITSAIDYGDSEYNKYFPERARLKGLAQVKFDFKHLFIDAIAGQIKDLRAILQDFPADVLLADPAVVAAKIMGDQDVLPWAVLNITVLGIYGRDVAPFGLGILPNSTTLGRIRNQALYFLAQRIVFRDVQQHYDRLARRHGWPIFPFAPSASPFLYLQPSVETFEYPRSDLPAQLHYIGPLLPGAAPDFAPPHWWSDVTNATRPVVLVTQGTIATDAEQLIAPTLKALANEDVLVVATTGGKTADELGLRVPANARVAPFIPFMELLPHVQVMITNGGYGGVTMALANGVPLISGGTTEDKAEVGNRIAFAGVGINLKTATPSPEQIGRAVTAILSDASFRQKAVQMQATFAKHDASGDAVRLLEQLATSKRPVVRTTYPMQVILSPLRS